MRAFALGLMLISLMAAAADPLREWLDFGTQRLGFEEGNFARSVAVGELMKWRLVDEPCLLWKFAEDQITAVRLELDSPVPRCRRCEEMRSALPGMRARLTANTLTDDDRAWIRSHQAGPLGLVALALDGRVYLYSHGHSQLTCGFALTASVPSDAALKAEVLRQWPNLRALKR